MSTFDKLQAMRLQRMFDSSTKR
ncbi:hypothetical protein ADUPG1_007412, partial [Aduncisulcus paluster]